MSQELHPVASRHLPFFVSAPGQPDHLMTVALVVLLLAVFVTGIIYLKLHAIPERLAHRGQKIQFQVVAVLGLLALFTHIHLFWIAALLLALVELPDFSTPVRSMAQSLDVMARRGAPPTVRMDGNGGPGDDMPTPTPVAPPPVADGHHAMNNAASRPDGAGPAAPRV